MVLCTVGGTGTVTVDLERIRGALESRAESFCWLILPSRLRLSILAWLEAKLETCSDVESPPKIFM